MKLKDKLKNISKEKQVDFNVLLRLYMYDRFIERLSVSKYKDNFILKGGFYLSTLFGVENRSTMDIDTSFRDADFNEINVSEMIKEIISININDGAKISFLDISTIRDEDEYGGFRIELMVEFENIKEKFSVDVATGDPITPSAILYKYKTILHDKTIKVWAYNIETLLAEKLETILSRLELNGRMRDFYDVYLICTNDWTNVNKDNLKLAIENTFKKRGFNNDLYPTLKVISDSSILRKRWENYSKKYEYAKNISFDEILECIDSVVSVLDVITI